MNELFPLRDEYTTRVLLVDDDEAIRSVIGQLLVRLGFVCATAADGVEALARLEQEEFHLLVTDIQMPGMGGADLIALVKERFPQVGVIWMTGFVDNTLLEKMFQAGAREYLLKPFGQREICTCIQRVTEQKYTMPPLAERKWGGLFLAELAGQGTLPMGRLCPGSRRIVPGNRK